MNKYISDYNISFTEGQHRFLKCATGGGKSTAVDQWRASLMEQGYKVVVVVMLKKVEAEYIERFKASGNYTKGDVVLINHFSSNKADNLYKLVDLETVHDKTFFFIDEPQQLISDANFRNEMAKTLIYLQRAKNVVYLSATPSDVEFLVDEVEEFKLERTPKKLYIKKFSEWHRTTPIKIITEVVSSTIRTSTVPLFLMFYLNDKKSIEVAAEYIKEHYAEKWFNKFGVPFKVHDYYTLDEESEAFDLEPDKDGHFPSVFFTTKKCQAGVNIRHQEHYTQFGQVHVIGNSSTVAETPNGFVQAAARLRGDFNLLENWVHHSDVYLWSWFPSEEDEENCITQEKYDRMRERYLEGGRSILERTKHSDSEEILEDIADVRNLAEKFISRHDYLSLEVFKSLLDKDELEVVEVEELDLLIMESKTKSNYPKNDLKSAGLYGCGFLPSEFKQEDLEHSKRNSTAMSKILLKATRKLKHYGLRHEHAYEWLTENNMGINYFRAVEIFADLSEAIVWRFINGNVSDFKQYVKKGETNWHEGNEQLADELFLVLKFLYNNNDIKKACVCKAAYNKLNFARKKFKMLEPVESIADIFIDVEDENCSKYVWVTDTNEIDYLCHNTYHKEKVFFDTRTITREMYEKWLGITAVSVKFPKNITEGESTKETKYNIQTELELV